MVIIEELMEAQVDRMGLPVGQMGPMDPQSNPVVTSSSTKSSSCPKMNGNENKTKIKKLGLQIALIKYKKYTHIFCATYKFH